MKRKIIILGILVMTMFVNVYGIESDEIEAEELVKSTTNWDENELPIYPEGQPEVTILKITIPPGAELPMHEHPVINTGVLLKGDLICHVL